MLCKTARQLQAAVSGTIGGTAVVGEHNDGFLRTRKVLERRDGTSAEGEWYVVKSRRDQSPPISVMRPRSDFALSLFHEYSLLVLRHLSYVRAGFSANTRLLPTNTHSPAYQPLGRIDGPRTTGARSPVYNETHK